MIVKTKNKFTQEEQHALIYGFCEVLPPWPPQHRLDPPDYVTQEPHYYRAGRTLGFLAYIPLAVIIHLVFF